jgi:hypothetical protein
VPLPQPSSSSRKLTSLPPELFKSSNTCQHSSGLGLAQTLSRGRLFSSSCAVSCTPSAMNTCRQRFSGFTKVGLSAESVERQSAPAAEALGCAAIAERLQSFQGRMLKERTW